MSSCPARWAGVSVAASRSAHEGAAVVVVALVGVVVLVAVVPVVGDDAERGGLEDALEVLAVDVPPARPASSLPAQAAAPSSVRARVEAPRTRLLRRGRTGRGLVVAGIRSNLSRPPAHHPNP
jgi:hypothetical protein